MLSWSSPALNASTGTPIQPYNPRVLPWLRCTGHSYFSTDASFPRSRWSTEHAVDGGVGDVVNHSVAVVWGDRAIGFRTEDPGIVIIPNGAVDLVVRVDHRSLLALQLAFLGGWGTSRAAFYGCPWDDCQITPARGGAKSLELLQGGKLALEKQGPGARIEPASQPPQG